MRHSRIAKSNRHKKFKSVNNSNDFTVNEIKIKNLSEQTIPKKWQQIMEMKDQFNAKLKQKKKKKKTKIDLICVKTDSEPIEKGMTRSDKQLPEVIEQGLYESEAHFMSRLSKLSAKARAEATIEDRFDVDFCQRLDTSCDLNEDKSQNKEKKSKNNTLKRKLRRINKRQNKQNKDKDNSFSHLSDSITFGDRVDEPPVLKFKNKKLKK